MYNQARDLRDYASRIEISLRNTYGYRRMGEEAKGALVRAADEYGHRPGAKSFRAPPTWPAFGPRQWRARRA